MREIKFRVWHKTEKMMFSDEALKSVYVSANDGWIMDTRIDDGIDGILMQYTGIKDKNGLTEIYEGDIIDVDGLKKGNVYENEKEETDLVIENMGTEAWRSTEQKAMERGCKYSE